MTLLMIVGSADDIFIYNIAKWLKHSMDITIDIIELNTPDNKGKTYDFNYYDRVDTIPQGFILSSIPLLRRFTYKYLYEWQRCRQLEAMLKDRHYDIIQIHLVGGLYAGADYLKKHCNRLYYTFWGGEIRNKTYFGSHKFYRDKLRNNIRRYADGIINTSIHTARYWAENDWEPLFFQGSFGSAPLESIYDILEKEGRGQCKSYWGMPDEKLSVQLGYSGKDIHQYLEIISELNKHESLKSKLHLVAPMTRGSNPEYTAKVRAALESSGYSFTLIEKHLTDREMAQLRCSIDIVLQLTIWDGYSRSIIEALCSGSILIYGDWLKYKELFSIDGFEGIPVDSIADGVNKISVVLNNIDAYKKNCESNIESGKSKYLWSECIKDWVAVYNGTAKPLN